MTTSTGRTAAIRSKPAPGSSASSPTICSRRTNTGRLHSALSQTFLQGTVKTFTVVPSPTELGWRSLEGAGFIEDTIKLTPRLELRAGFRSESTNGWNEAQGRASNYALARRRPSNAIR